ncbi:Cysteine/serine-rich nuclear protein 2, partial [Opisthocomus hoazin]
SILKKSKRLKKNNVEFDRVTVFYFPRCQGFTSVPSRGGCTLGMVSKHSSSRQFTLAEFSKEQENVRRGKLEEKLKEEKLEALKWKLTMNGTKESEEANQLTIEDISDDDIDVSNVDLEEGFFLQPYPAKKRRALLKAVGVKKIDKEEKRELHNIRLSREDCGCDCREVCDPETCSCSLAGWGCCGAGGCRWTGAGCACHCSPLAAAGTWRCCRCLLSNLSLSQRGAEAHDMDQALNLMTQYIKTHVCALMSPFGALHFAFLEPFNFSYAGEEGGRGQGDLSCFHPADFFIEDHSGEAKPVPGHLSHLSECLDENANQDGGALLEDAAHARCDGLSCCASSPAEPCSKSYADLSLSSDSLDFFQSFSDYNLGPLYNSLKEYENLDNFSALQFQLPNFPGFPQAGDQGSCFLESLIGLSESVPETPAPFTDNQLLEDAIKSSLMETVKV